MSFLTHSPDFAFVGRLFKGPKGVRLKLRFVHSFTFNVKKKKKHNSLTVVKFHGAEIEALPTPAMRRACVEQRDSWVGE